MESFNLKIFLRNTLIAGFLTTVLGLISQTIIERNTRFEQKKINERAAFDKTIELFYQRRYLMWQKLNCISDSTTSQEIKEYYNNKYRECLVNYNTQITLANASPIFRDFIGAQDSKYLEKNAWATLHSYQKLCQFFTTFHTCLTYFEVNDIDKIDAILRKNKIKDIIDRLYLETVNPQPIANKKVNIPCYSMTNKNECRRILNFILWEVINKELFKFIDIWNKEIYLEVKESAKPSKQ